MSFRSPHAARLALAVLLVMPLACTDSGFTGVSGSAKDKPKTNSSKDVGADGADGEDGAKDAGGKDDGSKDDGSNISTDDSTSDTAGALEPGLTTDDGETSVHKLPILIYLFVGPSDDGKDYAQKFADAMRAGGYEKIDQRLDTDGPLTKDVLDKYRIIQVVNGCGSTNSFTDDELAALKDYFKRGGSIGMIVNDDNHYQCGWTAPSVFCSQVASYGDCNEAVAGLAGKLGVKFTGMHYLSSGECVPVSGSHELLQGVSSIKRSTPARTEPGTPDPDWSADVPVRLGKYDKGSVWTDGDISKEGPYAVIEAGHGHGFALFEPDLEEFSCDGPKLYENVFSTVLKPIKKN